MKDIIVAAKEIETEHVKKFIRYGISNNCGTNERCWKETKSKYLKNTICYTIQHKRVSGEEYQIKYQIEKIFNNIKHLLIEELLKIGAYNSNFAAYSKNLK